MGVDRMRQRNPHARRHQQAREVSKADVQAMAYANLMGSLGGDMPDEKKRRLMADALGRGDITEQQHASLVRRCCA